MQLYAGLKGVPQNSMGSLITERLQAVNLDQVADNRVYTFSGGMKRRLSLIISTIGDPDIMFLDEPTTGMDPVNRRRVWEFIEKFKKDRIIILTTHSMEEADILGDRIAIMAHGRICAIGDSMDLKRRFGKGYAVTIVAEPNKVEETKNTLKERFPLAVSEDESAGALIYHFLEKDGDNIPLFIRHIDKNSSGLIRNWGISQSTLEEVFLKIIREANPHGYRGIIH
jgi:ABC-type multidrug transport system ATPase subunit